jgi:hypothetical protein
MAKKWYGNIMNRIEEGHIFGDDKTIKEGMDITMYFYSDRDCYYVSRVIDQKHIFVKRYHVVADRSKRNDMGHQNWKYFKTLKEENEYLHSFFPEGNHNLNPIESGEQEWMFRNGSWKRVDRWTLEQIEAAKKNHFPFYIELSDKEKQKLAEGKEIVKYNKLSGNVSFGVREHYYDWSF